MQMKSNKHTDDKVKNLENLNKDKKLKLPNEFGGVFLPKGHERQFDFMFIAEMPSMNKPKNWDGKENFIFNLTARDHLLQETMRNNGVGGSYVTDIVKRRAKPGKPTPYKIKKWRSFLLNLAQNFSNLLTARCVPLVSRQE